MLHALVSKKIPFIFIIYYPHLLNHDESDQSAPSAKTHSTTTQNE